MSSTGKALEVYLEMDEKGEITKERVKQLHDEQMLNGNHDKKNESQIVDIIGGIDVILNTYLDERNDLFLTNKQILRLYQLLKTPIPYQQKNKPVLSQNITMNNQINNEQQTQFSYIFDVNETILHSLFSLNAAQKIIHFIDHKIVLMLLLIAVIVGIFLGLGLGFESLIYSVYMIAMFGLLWIPWLILKHLSLNKTALTLCVKTFDFWIKTGYGFIGIVAALFHGASNGHIFLSVKECIVGVVAVLGIAYIAAFDASNSNKRTKFAMSLFMALIFSFWSINDQFFLSEEADYKIRIQLTNSIISMQSIMASSSRILALFFWKQCINTLRKKGRAVSITCSPIIIWRDCNDNKENEIKYEEKEDKTKRMEINIEEENDEINTENVLRKREEKRESISWSMHDDEMKEMEKTQNESKQGLKSKENEECNKIDSN